MTLDIPHTFVAGTKAKANEVNENFLAVKSFVDNSEDLIEEAQTDILNLQSDKADLNGDIEQKFDVADATGNYHSVNLQTYKRLSNNVVDYIRGYQLSKFDNNTVTAQPGSCYDSTREKIITSDSALTATQANLSANALYYVYVTYDSDTLNLVIDLSNSAPSGYTYYRQLGYFTADGSGHINSISSESNESNKAVGPFTYGSNYWVMGTDINVSNLIPNDGYIYMVWLYRHIGGSGSGGANEVGTDIFPVCRINMLDGDAGRHSNTIALVSIPIGTGRTITASQGVYIQGFMKLYKA